jgi:hypothetical protein
VVVALGLAGQYHLEALLELLQENALLLVAEPQPRAVLDVMPHVDLWALQKPGVEIRFVASSDVEEICAELLQVLRQRFRLDLALFIQPGLKRVFPELYGGLFERLVRQARMERAQRVTASELSRGWMENALKNLPLLLARPGIEAIKDFFRGMPAVVVAAGPSLDAAIPWLQTVTDRVLVICVGTAYRTLWRAGIRPDIVVVVDGAPIIWEQFQDVPCGETIFLTPAHIDARILSCFREQLYSFSSGALPAFDQWLAESGAPADELRTAGTVTLTALDAALYLGSSEVWIVGLDLACRDDGTSHASHTMYRDHAYGLQGLVTVPGNWRPRVWTTAQFAMYIDLLGGFAREVAESGRGRLINVNHDGARIAGMECCLPDQVESRNWPSLVQTKARFRKGAYKPRGVNMEPERLFAQTQEQLQELEKKAGRAAELARKAGTTAVPERWLAELAELEQGLKCRDGGGLLVEAALKAATFKTLEFDVAAQQPNQLERVLKVCLELYGQMEMTATWIQEQLRFAEKQVHASEVVWE